MTTEARGLTTRGEQRDELLGPQVLVDVKVAKFPEDLGSGWTAQAGAAAVRVGASRHAVLLRAASPRRRCGRIGSPSRQESTLTCAFER